MVVRGERHFVPIAVLRPSFLSAHAICQIFECVRKLGVACLPVIFRPSGSASQLICAPLPAPHGPWLRAMPDGRLRRAADGLMICFLAFGAYVHFDPYEDRGNDAVAKLCQMQIFFSLLASVALTSTSEQGAGSNMDILLVVLYFVPVRPL